MRSSVEAPSGSILCRKPWFNLPAEGNTGILDVADPDQALTMRLKRPAPGCPTEW